MFTATYTAVNESTARLSKEMSSFSDYVPGAATRSQHYYTDKIVEYANGLLAKYSTEDNEKTEKVQYYIDKYSTKVAETIDKQHAIDCRCPSVMISGGSNFPVAKKDKQIAAWDALNKETAELWYTDDRNYYYKKIRLLLTDSGAIRSDDKNAVDKIKAKIAKLEAAEPDRWGYNKTEIRRLKERLLQLAPDEVKAGKEITINGEPATYDNIIKIFDSYKPDRSKYSPEEERYYLGIPLVFSDGSRKYKGYISNEVNADATQISTYGNADNNYQTIWKPLDDSKKFAMVIGQIRGSGNKAVIFSILQDLDPRRAQAKAEIEANKIAGEDAWQTSTINSEPARIVENSGEMRLQVFFEGKPEQATREMLKANGFKWAPSQKAWQRLLNDNAKLALKRICTA